MPQETELKLALHPHDLPRLLAHPLLVVQPARRERLRNTYFDTAALTLMQQRLAVRERHVGRRTLLTVKTAGHSVGGLSQRGEWEAPTTPGRFDFATLVDNTALAQQLTELAPQLVPVFRTDFTRRSWLLQHGGAQVEVALDQGFIATGQVSDARREPLLELELELKSGPVDALLDLAHTLALGPQGRTAQGIWLHPTDRSKAERGLALFLNQQPGPQKAQAVVLAAGLSPLMAFRAVALGSLVHLQANVSGWLQARSDTGTPADTEYIHQARVALRRLRTALRLFAPALPRGFVTHWRIQWQATAHALADAREWDVLATETWPKLLADSTVGPPKDLPTDWLNAQRQAAHQRAQAALSAPAHALNLLAFTRALLALQGSKRRPNPAAQSRWASRALQPLQQALLRRARLTHAQDAAERHALRLALKKHRQAQEVLAGCAPDPISRREAAQLAQAQGLLGALNDLSVAQRQLAPCPHPGTAWLLDRLQEQLKNELLALPRLQRRLVRALAP